MKVISKYPLFALDAFPVVGPTVLVSVKIPCMHVVFLTQLETLVSYNVIKSSCKRFFKKYLILEQVLTTFSWGPTAMNTLYVSIISGTL